MPYIRGEAPCMLMSRQRDCKYRVADGLCKSPDPPYFDFTLLRNHAVILMGIALRRSHHIDRLGV